MAVFYHQESILPAPRRRKVDSPHFQKWLELVAFSKDISKKAQDINPSSTAGNLRLVRTPAAVYAEAEADDTLFPNNRGVATWLVRLVGKRSDSIGMGGENTLYTRQVEMTDSGKWRLTTLGSERIWRCVIHDLLEVDLGPQGGRVSDYVGSNMDFYVTHLERINDSLNLIEAAKNKPTMLSTQAQARLYDLGG